MPAETSPLDFGSQPDSSQAKQRGRGKPRSPLRFLFLLPALMFGAFVAFALLKSWLFDPDRKVYNRTEFESVMRGKTESEVAAILGAPQVTGQEPWDSPQADKRYTAHHAGGSKWTIAGEDGAVVIFYSTDKNRADYFLYVPRPPSGRSITIRW